MVLTDATISNWHLRIYSIIYDSSVVPVLCFTYAEDLSSNGSYWLYETDGHWQEYLIGKGHAVLLSDGDRVRLCDGSCFVFSFSASCHLITHMEDDDNQAEMDMDDFYREQVKDMKVSLGCT